MLWEQDKALLTELSCYNCTQMYCNVSASDSTFDFWRCINISLTLTLTFDFTGDCQQTRVELCAYTSDRERSTHAGEACMSDRQPINGNSDSCLCERSLWRGTFACIKFQVTLCDAMWLVTLCTAALRYTVDYY